MTMPTAEQMQRHFPNCISKAVAIAVRRSARTRYAVRFQVNQLETLLERVCKMVTSNWKDRLGIPIVDMIIRFHKEADCVRRVDDDWTGNRSHSYLVNIGWEELTDFSMVCQLVQMWHLGIAVVVIADQGYGGGDGRQHAFVADSVGRGGASLRCSDARDEEVKVISRCDSRWFAVWAVLPEADVFLNGERLKEIHEVQFQPTFNLDVLEYLEAYLDEDVRDWLWHHLAEFKPVYLENARQDGDTIGQAQVQVDLLKQFFLELLRKRTTVDSDADSGVLASCKQVTGEGRRWCSLPDFVKCCSEHGLSMDCQKVDLEGAIAAAEFPSESDVVLILRSSCGLNVPFFGIKWFCTLGSSWEGTIFLPEDARLPESLGRESVVEAYKLAPRPAAPTLERDLPFRLSALPTYTCDRCEHPIDGSHFRSTFYSRYDVCVPCRRVEAEQQGRGGQGFRGHPLQSQFILLRRSYLQLRDDELR